MVGERDEKGSKQMVSFDTRKNRVRLITWVMSHFGAMADKSSVVRENTDEAT